MPLTPNEKYCGKAETNNSFKNSCVDFCINDSLTSSFPLRGRNFSFYTRKQFVIRVLELNLQNKRKFRNYLKSLRSNASHTLRFMSIDVVKIPKSSFPRPLIAGSIQNWRMMTHQCYKHPRRIWGQAVGSNYTHLVQFMSWPNPFEAFYTWV